MRDPPLDTQGSLTFDIDIASYTITPFLSSFIYFTLEVYQRARKQRASLPQYPPTVPGRYGGPVNTPPLFG